MSGAAQRQLAVDGLLVSLAPVRVADAARIEQWRDIERHAADPNAFLSPRFVLPALRRLGGDDEAQLLTVERDGAARDALLALAVVVPRGAGRRLPFAHLAGFRSPYSAVGGSLLRRGVEAEAARALYTFLADPQQPWSALLLPRACAGHDLPAFATPSSLPGDCRWQVLDSLSRPVLPLTGGRTALASGLSGRRAKELRRKWRRLAECGELRWECRRGAAIDEALVDAFLDLEHGGWKGREGSSLRADAASEHFFRDMLAGFAADGDAFCSLLSLDGQPLSITCNLISGPRGFAFKLGWDSRWARYSPAMLDIAELSREAAALLPDLELIDSCATAGGFADSLWSARRSLHDCCLITRRRARVAFAARELTAALLPRSA